VHGSRAFFPNHEEFGAAGSGDELAGSDQALPGTDYYRLEA